MIDSSSRHSSIFLFKNEDLPLDLDKRFDILFQTREKWTLEDITPYVKYVNARHFAKVFLWLISITVAHESVLHCKRA